MDSTVEEAGGEGGQLVVLQVQILQLVLGAQQAGGQAGQLVVVERDLIGGVWCRVRCDWRGMVSCGI